MHFYFFYVSKSLHLCMGVSKHESILRIDTRGYAGYFFNGRQFVSFDGDKSDRHPKFEDFVADWLKEQSNPGGNVSRRIMALRKC